MCFGCSKELSHRDGSFEYPQHMFWLRNKKNNFQSHTLIWGPDMGLETRKQVLGICNQVMIKPACSATKTSSKVSCGKLNYRYFQRVNNKGADQAVQMLFECNKVQLFSH